tara:strand:- start:733 stop:2148 length:1416 start_codon:yes stop_codon:yes gene_type:complete
MSKIEVDQVDPQSGTTLTLGTSGDTVNIPSGVTITNNGTQTGFGRTGTVDWQTGSIKTTSFTAVNTQGFFVDTNGGAITATLPAGSAGAIISFQDYRNTFDTNALTISPQSGEKINGGEGSIILNTEGEGVTLVYIDSTIGWRSIQDNVFADTGSNFISATGGTITCSGNDRIHTFTGPGTFTVQSLAASSANNEVSYVVVAGGGGGGCQGGGGGGAGGYRETKSPATPYTASPLDGQPSAPNRVTVTATSFPITVGGGGTGVSPPAGGPVNQAPSGGVSTFSTITSAGGSGGGTGPQCGATLTAGGSGGGGRANQANNGAAGNTPSTTPAQGTAGGAGGVGPGTVKAGGGGGGATDPGSNGGPTRDGGPGGDGASSEITGSAIVRSGGGGGGSDQGTPTPGSPGTGGSGGPGGGGAGGIGTGPGPTAGSAGTDNTGGGGGGGTNSPGTSPNPAAGGNGGSGVVIIRYKVS